MGGKKFSIVLTTSTKVRTLCQSRVLPSVVIKSFSSMGPSALRCFRSGRRVRIYVLGPRGSSASARCTVQRTVHENTVRVIIVNTANAEVSRMLKGVDLLNVNLRARMGVDLISRRGHVHVVGRPVAVQGRRRCKGCISLVPFSRGMYKIALHKLGCPLASCAVNKFGSLKVDGRVISSRTAVSFSSKRLVIVRSGS